MLVVDLNEAFTLTHVVAPTDTEEMFAMELSVGGLVRYILPSEVAFILLDGTVFSGITKVLSLSFSITSTSSLGKIHRLKLKRKVVDENMAGDWYETIATQRIYVNDSTATSVWGD